MTTQQDHTQAPMRTAKYQIMTVTREPVSISRYFIIQLKEKHTQKGCRESIAQISLSTFFFFLISAKDLSTENSTDVLIFF